MPRVTWNVSPEQLALEEELRSRYGGMMTATDVAKILGVSVGHAYKIIKKLNVELEQAGYLVIAGKVPRGYFEKRWYGFASA